MARLRSPCDPDLRHAVAHQERRCRLATSMFSITVSRPKTRVSWNVRPTPRLKILSGRRFVIILPVEAHRPLAHFLIARDDVEQCGLARTRSGR